MTDPIENLADAFGVDLADLLVHPSGECRCAFPGTNIVCRLAFAHDGDHDGGPIRLNSGEMSKPLRWEQDRPEEETP